MRTIRCFLLISVFFSLFNNFDLFAEDVIKGNTELGKISITIEPFQYSERSDVEKYGVYWENAAYHHPKGLGDISEYGFRIFTKKWVEATYKAAEEAKVFSNDAKLSIFFRRPRSLDKVIEYLKEFGAIEISVIKSGNLGNLEVPSGEYYLDYYVVFTTGQVFTPGFKNRARQSAKFTWGPSKIFVSPRQTISITIKPGWMNVYGAPHTNFCTTNSYLNDLIEEIMKND